MHKITSNGYKSVHQQHLSVKKSLWEPRKAAFLAGAKAISPILLGVFPFATIAGITIVSVGVSAFPAIAMSVIVFAGASQIAVADLIGKGAPFIIIVLTALVINLRFMMYSASIAPHFKRIRPASKWTLAYLLTDQAYAVSILKFSAEPDAPNKHWYYAGCAIIMWLTWQIGTVIGVYLGLQVPRSWSLDFAIPLTFMALLLPTVKDVASAAAAIASGCIAVVGLNLPLNTGIIVAAASGIAVGFGIESLQGKKENASNGS
ncbi:MAG: AzlC family ABC transporter permease [Desulfobacterales bacterium]|nr:AzlC family ABC transporter permease [Desulfobacterales bacterium]